MLTGFGALVAVGATVEAPKVVLVTAIIAAVIVATVGLVILGARLIQRRREEIAAIAARADDQHQAVLRGDEQWGVYGQGPPAPSGWHNTTAITDGSSAQRKPDRTWVLVGGAVATALALFAILTTMNARSADRSSGLMNTPSPTSPTPTAQRHQRMPAPAPSPLEQLVPLLPIPGISSPSTTVAPTVPNGMSAKVGQQVADGQLTFVVTSFDRSKTAGNTFVPDMAITARGIFANLHVTITNTGRQPVVFFAADQKFKVNNVAFHIDPAAALWTFATAVVVSPAASVPVTLSFDVPTDMPPSGTLQLHQSSMSRGVDIAVGAAS
jgi:hypothetical protein